MVGTTGHGWPLTFSRLAKALWEASLRGMLAGAVRLGFGCALWQFYFVRGDVLHEAGLNFGVFSYGNVLAAKQNVAGL